MPTALTCSFCGKHEHEVARLACERRDRICNECLSLCTEILAEPNSRSKPAPPGRDLRCSFCGQSEHVAKRLIAGPTVFICDGCVVRLAAGSGTPSPAS